MFKLIALFGLVSCLLVGCGDDDDGGFTTHKPVSAYVVTDKVYPDKLTLEKISSNGDTTEVVQITVSETVFNTCFIKDLYPDCKKEY